MPRAKKSASPKPQNPKTPKPRFLSLRGVIVKSGLIVIYIHLDPATPVLKGEFVESTYWLASYPPF